MSALKNFIEAYADYLNGKSVQIPGWSTTPGVYSLKTRTLHQLHINDIFEKGSTKFRPWKVMDSEDVIEKVIKYQVLFMLDSKYELSFGHYEDENEWDTSYREGDDAYRYEFVKLVEETAREFDKIVKKYK